MLFDCKKCQDVAPISLSYDSLPGKLLDLCCTRIDSHKDTDVVVDGQAENRLDIATVTSRTLCNSVQKKS